MHVGHLPLTALEPNLRRNQGGAFRKDRQLQLRHASILPSPSLSRKRTGGQLIFQNGSQNHGMRSGVLKFVPSIRSCSPKLCGPWVLNLAERLQVPADYPAAALIVMLAGALGRRASIRPQRHDSWMVVPNLWGAIIGRSGVMKSPVLRAVMGPLRRHQALAMTVYESEMDAYQ